MILTAGQALALDEINAAYAAERGQHLLTGYAGSGKTTLMQHVTRGFLDRGLEVVVTAPTHKAVGVLTQKMKEADITKAACRTIHSLLSLKPSAAGPRTVLKRGKKPEVVTADVVIIDECSMISAELLEWIDKLLPHCFVLMVGDPAQLPPVNEIESKTFSIQSRSHLDTIVRQAVGNPILAAASAIRVSQGGPLDCSWCRDARSEKQGVFLPANSEAWIKRAFTSEGFKADNDRFRYLCWTNERVHEVNTRVRRWIYGGDTPTPFMPEERVLLRAPVLQNEIAVMQTNQEVTVAEIKKGEYRHEFRPIGPIEPWVAIVPTWEITLTSDDGLSVSVHMPADQDALAPIEGRLLREAKLHPARWHHRFEFRQSLAQLQAIYAMTVHCSQGSTFMHAFVDVGDIRRRARSNVLETQQLLYVAATRPSEALILIGAKAAA